LAWAGQRQRATYAISPIGDTDGRLFASLSRNATRTAIVLAKRVEVEPTFADAEITKLKKGEKLWHPWTHDLELSAGRIRVES
jgi:hypothetical protein